MLKFLGGLKLSLLCTVFRIAQYYGNKAVTKTISRFLARQFNSCTLSELIQYTGSQNHSGLLGEFYTKSGLPVKYGLWASPSLPRVSVDTDEHDYINYPHICITNMKRSFCMQTCESMLLIQSLKKYGLDWYVLENNPIHPMDLSDSPDIESGEIIIVD